MSFEFITMEEVYQAKRKLYGVIEDTPMLGSATFSRMSGNTIMMKAEVLQKTGSFKIRGAFNSISCLTPEQKKRGVITCTAGNAGAGMAYAAQMQGVPAVVLVPETFVKAKADAIEGYGAKLISYGKTSGEMIKKTLEIAEENGYTMIYPYEHNNTIAGQATIGLEIIEQMPDVDAVVVQTSGGGLLAGIAFAVKNLKPTVKVIGVNPDRSRAMYESLKAGKLVTVPVDTIADGLGVETPGALNFAYIQQYVDDFVLVSEKEIALATKLLAERAKLYVEPAGATGLAAMISGKTDLVGKKVAVVLSGGNPDLDFMAALFNDELDLKD